MAPSRRSQRLPSRPGPTTAVLAFAGMGAAFMQTILIPIQGELPALLGASRADAAWVITATLLAAAICTPISGKLGDMYGKRRIALVLLGLLVLGSVIAALSYSVGPMIVGRVLQGTGLGIVPLGIALLRDVLPKDRLGGAIALVSATLGVGGALGLPLSAFVTENYDWHALFWVATAIGLLAFVLVLLVIPPTGFGLGGRFDFVGAAGLALGLTGVLLGVSRGNEWGWGAPLVVGLLTGGVIVLVIWGVVELRVVDPLVDLRVSARPPVLLTNLASIAMGFALFASSIVFPQLLQRPTVVGGMGLSLLQASFILMPSGLAMLALSPVSGRLQRRVGPKPLLVWGAIVIAISYLGILLVDDLQFWHVLIGNTVLGIGIGLGYAAMPALIMRAVPATETGAANGLNNLMRALGTTAAAAVVAGILTQSAQGAGGVFVPSAEGFRMALGLGLIASVACAAIAAFIPHSTPHPGEVEAIQDAAI